MDSEIQGFFKNKTVFLTGGTGFLGKGTPLLESFRKLMECAFQ